MATNRATMAAQSAQEAGIALQVLASEPPTVEVQQLRSRLRNFRRAFRTGGKNCSPALFQTFTGLLGEVVTRHTQREQLTATVAKGLRALNFGGRAHGSR